MEHLDFARRWGDLILAKRKAAGLRQVDLAPLIGTGQGSISTWERGDGVPSPVMQARLILKLKITPAELAALYALEPVAAEAGAA